jgi:SAM-dependent methyltransferase
MTIADNEADPSTFRALHAVWYDRFHPRKDYPAEVAQIRGVFDRCGPVGSVLDLGCGTGRHLDLFAAAGHEVVGVDRSPTMLAAAKERLASYQPRASLVEADLLKVALGRTFDAVTVLFGLMSYQVSNDEALAMLEAARRHLNPGGLVVFDVLDAMTALTGAGYNGGLAVITEGDQRLLCGHSERLRADRQILELSLRMWLLELGRLVDQDEELHPLRFFLARELELLLRLGGFQLLDSAPLAGEGVPPGQETFRLVWGRRM